MELRVYIRASCAVSGPQHRFLTSNNCSEHAAESSQQVFVSSMGEEIDLSADG